MKKRKNIILGVVGVLALFGICFGCLSIYAKKEINKPKFELPEAVSEQPMTPLPATKEEAFDYVSALFTACTAADDIELNQHTDVHLNADGRTTPFGEADNAVLSRVMENVQGAVGALYPVTESTLMTELAKTPVLDFSRNDITEFTATQGYTDENGEVIDDGYYYITLNVNPAALNTDAMLNSEARTKLEQELAPLLSVSSLDIQPESYTANFKIHYTDDMLVWAELKKNVSVKAAVDFKEDYKALEDKTASFVIPYEAVQSMDFFHYGLHFTERQMAVENKDMKALPLEVRVDGEATKDDYKMTYTVSKDGILDIDADGVMNVIGTQEEPVTVTAMLEYDGHTYTDTLTVYATELEVKTDEP